MNPSPQSALAKLLAGPMRYGELVWIGIRASRRGAITPVQSITLVAEKGIEGDHYQTSHNGARQVTVCAQEDIAAVASFIGRDRVAPELLRRNLVTRGINVMALKNRRFRVGGALLEWSGECAPCGLMEEALGPGGYNAVRGHGGITARIIVGGRIATGDAIVRVDDPT